MRYSRKKKNFVCLFPWLIDVTATKCTGQISDTIAMKYNLNSYIVTYRNEEFKRFHKYCPHTKLIFLKGKLKRSWSVFIDLFWFTLLNSKKIDILYLYHFPADNIIIPFIGYLYKLINRKGTLYIRLEADITNLPQTFPTIEQKGLTNKIKNNIKKSFYKSVDILGVIDNTSFDLSRRLKLWQIIGDKFKVQLNGYRYYERLPNKLFEEKENNIILAGRLYAKQKGLDVFLRALKKIDLKDWKVILLGEISQDQIEKIKEIENENISIKGKIKILGHLSNLSNYLQVLNNAKVFCLPSRFDGIPLVIPDAMAHGCVIVGSDLYGIKEIATNNGECGFYFKNEDVDELVHILYKIIEGDVDLKKISIRALKRAEKNFHWNSIVKNLNIERFLK